MAANDFKYWDLMRRACERGVRVFDYGRSKRGTGSFDFKKNWASSPLRSPTSTSCCGGYDAAEQPVESALRGLHFAVAAAADRPRQPAGPLIVRNLG